MTTTFFGWFSGLVVLGVLSVGSRAVAQDPGDTGPCAVAPFSDYDFGDQAFLPTDFAAPPGVEVRARVYCPIADPTCPGPFPFVLFLHGRHVTCYQGIAAFLEWPCSPGRSEIPSYQGYEYIQQVLASWGYIVTSIGANGINARDNNLFDLGAQARAELINHHLDRWNVWNTIGGPPFGTQFVGQVNLNNVGTMGHSRGGEGVARHYVANLDAGSPYGIKAVLPLAPVDFNRDDVTQVPLEVILPYCDGDVSDLQGIHYVDDARYAPADPRPKYTTLVIGANHNYFNRIWTPGEWPAGTADDWGSFVPGGNADSWCGTVAGNHRLTPAQQRGVGRAYVVGFFRLHLGNELVFTPLYKGDVPAPPSAQTGEIAQSYLPADTAATRKDLNRLVNAGNLTTNTLEGSVTATELTPYDVCGGDFEPVHCLPTPPQPTSRQPHTTPSTRSSRRGLSQNRIGWDTATASIVNGLPPGTGNVSGLSNLQFRASVNFLEARNPTGIPQDFSVTLTDGGGMSATARVSASATEFFNPLWFPGGDVASTRPVPKIFLSTVRIPLSTFSGVDLINLQSVNFSFDQGSSGALLLSDVQFAD